MPTCGATMPPRYRRSCWSSRLREAAPSCTSSSHPTGTACAERRGEDISGSVQASRRNPSLRVRRAPAPLRRRGGQGQRDAGVAAAAGHRRAVRDRAPGHPAGVDTRSTGHVPSRQGEAGVEASATALPCPGKGSGFPLERQMHPFVAAVLLRMSGLDALNVDPEPQPPHR